MDVSILKLHASAVSPALYKTVLFIAVLASTACVSNTDVQRVGDGHYRAAAHASDSYQAEMRALNAAYTHCEKLKLSTVFDDFRNSETTSKDGAMVIVSMTFQCKVVPNPCNEPNVSCTDPQPLYPRK